MASSPASISDAITRANAIVESEAASMVPGLSVAVGVNGTQVWSQCFGYADVAAKIPVTATTRFVVASVSKPLTAAGLALLVERGLIDLDAPVQRYLPDFPEKDGVITVRLLAGHLSGIRNYRGTEALNRTAHVRLRDGLKVFENDPLESPPGTKFSYCSYNWNVIGAVMEAVTKQDFPRYLEENVFQPLGMADTRPARAGETDAQRAQLYEANVAGRFGPAPVEDLSSKWPSGGFLSTAEDLVRFGLAHLEPGFLKVESLRLLFTAQKTSTGEPTTYGVGWIIHPPIVYHGGGGWGGTAILLMLPGARTVVALASNGGHILLGNALRRGKAAPEMRKFIFNKLAVAAKIAALFAPRSAMRGGTA